LEDFALGFSLVVYNSEMTVIVTNSQRYDIAIYILKKATLAKYLNAHGFFQKKKICSCPRALPCAAAVMCHEMFSTRDSTTVAMLRNGVVARNSPHRSFV
jgi:hypothetical protein